MDRAVTDPVITDLNELLAATGRETVADLADHASESLSSYSDMSIDVDDGGITIQVEDHGYALSYPFTLSEFWAKVDKADTFLGRLFSLLEFPEFSDERPSEDVMRLLADLLGVTRETLVLHIGDGWRVIDPDGLNVDAAVKRWLAADEPARVVVGVAAEHAYVAALNPMTLPPSEVDGGEDCTYVELWTDDMVPQLGAVIRAAAAGSGPSRVWRSSPERFSGVSVLAIDPWIGFSVHECRLPGFGGAALTLRTRVVPARTLGTALPSVIVDVGLLSPDRYVQYFNRPATPGFVARVVAFFRGAAADLHPELSLAALSETSMGLTVSVVSSTEERVELQVTAIANLDAAVLEHDELNFETSRAALASAAQSVLLLDGTDSPVDTSGLH